MISSSISSRANKHFSQPLLMLLLRRQWPYRLKNCCTPRIVQNSIDFHNSIAIRGYFTNTDSMKREDPYAQLGLQWGDGATLAEIKQAYKQKSLLYHPDVVSNNNHMDKQAAARKFQDLQRAYQTLVQVHSNLNGLSVEKDEEWRVSVWRNGDRLAVNRTDVAGVLKKRPAPSPVVNYTATGLLGHPDGRGIVTRGEYLGDGGGKITKSSSVGRGQNKWVQPKKLQPWNGGEAAHAARRASDFAKK
jgi:DnaJ domain